MRKESKELIEKAKQVVCQNHIILGREIEDCVNGHTYIDSKGISHNDGEYHMIMVRPFTRESYMELFKHGKEYCSKFEIYLISDSFMSQIRPDHYNYDSGEDDLLKSKWNENEIIEEIKNDRIQSGYNFEDEYKKDFNYFVLSRISTEGSCNKVIDIENIDKGKYNIIIEQQ